MMTLVIPLLFARRPIRMPLGLRAHRSTLRSHHSNHQAYVCSSISIADATEVSVHQLVFGVPQVHARGLDARHRIFPYSVFSSVSLRLSTLSSMVSGSN
ncbi:hypothetical protein BIW11_11045 [Tropilaelaps mercedesae]|uniref:Uncharacterized protein n=1 Tax=Tropilaelaps mercedesae TaxID=418985 RepID=A0A1V9XCU6_9ACAR|nr:hypothetical protein BIW11_11045 [Tropilaelaps mercedesae]